MIPDIPTGDPTVSVLIWACGVLVAANVAQWAWMVAVMRASRLEREEALAKLGELLEHNTRAITDLTIWIRSGGNA